MVDIRVQTRVVTPREPVHIHADRGDAEARFWLYPDVHVASSTGFQPSASKA
jgi:hypothetical protein